MSYLVTGAAGFIGSHVAGALLARGDVVIGADNLNDYYDPALKRSRLGQIDAGQAFTFEEIDIAGRAAVFDLFARHDIDTVVHLAAQAGVRRSLTEPEPYIHSNIIGFQNIIDAARDARVRHLVYASTSSVYGLNRALPYSVHQNADHPVSLYAATKKSNELVAHVYSQLDGLPTSGLRLFTVFGPWGRPDMSPFIFARKILAGETIQIFNNGRHARDFTYIDDCVDAIIRVADRAPGADPAWSAGAPDPASSCAPYRIYNVASGRPVPILEFLSALESAFGRSASKEFLPQQPGDMLETHADISELVRDTGFQPMTPLADAVARFAQWYQGYYHPA